MSENAPKPRRTRADRLSEVHERAMRRFDAIWEVARDERAQNLADRRFATIRGAQWEGQYAVGDDLDENGDPIPASSPRMEVPKFLRAIRRVKGDYRSSRKTVDFRPKGDDAGKRDADNLDGLYRADEHDSPGGGTAAYDTAFSEGIEGGIGAWRFRAAYEDESDEENEHQRIRIEPIYDADQSVFFDPDAKHPDKSDARYGFILFTLSKDAFEERYPDASPTTFADDLAWSYEWIRADDLTLAEYFEVDDRSVLRRTYRRVVTEKLDEEPEERTYDDAQLTAEREGEDLTLEAELEATGWEEVRRRRIRRQRVRKYFLSGSECLEDEGEIPGRYIPVVPYYAERAYVEGVERTQGMVRPVIDSTRLYNLMVSGLAEGAAGPADGTPIADPDQMAGGLDLIWASRKTKRPAYLPLHALRDEDGKIVQTGLSGTLPPTEVSPAMAALVQIAGADVAELSGANDRPEAVPANTSAAAIEMVNDQADVNDFLWQDNFALAMTHSGRVWLEMARELYVEPGRKMQARGPNGEKSVVKLAEPRTGEDGDYIANDLTAGDYDVEVDVGPATKTKQDATVRGMLAIGQQYTANGNTENANAALGVAVLNMDGEGLDAYQNWVRQQGLRAGWVEPTEEESVALKAEAEAAGQQQDPNTLLAQAQMFVAQAEMMKAETGRIEAETRRLAAEASAEKARADAAAALAGIDRADRKQILEEVRAETDSDRADASQTMEVARFERELTQQTEMADGDAD